MAAPKTKAPKAPGRHASAQVKPKELTLEEKRSQAAHKAWASRTPEGAHRVRAESVGDEAGHQVTETPKRKAAAKATAAKPTVKATKAPAKRRRARLPDANKSDPCLPGGGRFCSSDDTVGPVPNPSAATADDAELAEFGELLLGMPPDLMYSVAGHPTARVRGPGRGPPSWATSSPSDGAAPRPPWPCTSTPSDCNRSGTSCTSARSSEEAVEGTSTRQIWNLPSRMGKSLLASRDRGPAWCLDRYPRSNLILASYGDDLAMENLVEYGTILREHEADVRVQLRQDRQRQDRFATTDGGGLLAGGIQRVNRVRRR